MSEATPGPGAELRAAREELQVSIREVADALNLPTRVIEALETDDYDRLPPTVFTRGYLRSYARLLELPADALLARYPEVTEEVEITSDTRTGTHAVVTQSRQFLLPLGIGAVLIVLIVLWLLRDDEPQPAPARPSPAVPAAVSQPAETERPVEASEVADAAGEPVAAPTETDTSSMTTGAPPRTEPAEPSGPASGASVGEPAIDIPDAAPPSSVTDAETGSGAEEEPAVASSVVPTFRDRRITEFGDDRMRFRFAEDCWLEVKSLDGANLYSDLNRAGTTLELTGRAPFRVLLGYAPGVSLEFNGETVDLPRYSRNNVASVVLGQ